MRIEADHGARERMQHVPTDAVVVETAEATSSGQPIARRVRIKPPVECMGLDDELVEAARRFRDDWDLGVRGVRQGSDGPRIRSNLPPTTLPDAMLDALGRVTEMQHAMGPTHYVVTRVVVDEIGLSDLGRMLGRNRQELAGVLKCGLEALVEMRERRAA